MRDEGLHAFGREARGEGHGVLLGDADIEAAGREDLGEFVEAGARRHGRGDGDDPVVAPGLVDQAVGEDRGIGGALEAGLACAPVTTLNLPTP